MLLSLMSHLGSDAFYHMQRDFASRLCTAQRDRSSYLSVMHAIDGQEQHSAGLRTNMLLRTDETPLQIAHGQGWMGEPLLQPGAG